MQDAEAKVGRAILVSVQSRSAYLNMFLDSQGNHSADFAPSAYRFHDLSCQYDK